jgi:protoporphyrinogen oxidase
MPSSSDRRPAETLAVAGGGITGIAAALALAESGRFRVTLFEKSGRLGGLCAPTAIAGRTADRFYHVVLPGDRATLDFLAKLGPGGEIDFRPSKAGFYGRGRLVSFATAADFLRFPFLSPWSKVRLAAGILLTSFSAPPEGPAEPAAPEWLRRRFGRRVTARFWDPLLRSKLGEARNRTPASFIDATIKRLFGARSKSSGRERMGGVPGGYAAVIRSAETALREAGVLIRLGSPVDSIIPSAEGLAVGTLSGPEIFDRVFLAVPLPEALKIAGADADPGWERFRRVEHMGVVTLLLALRRSLSPYYLVNLLDTDLPFTGIVETTNVLGPESFGGLRLVYLPRYLAAGDPAARMTDGEIKGLFLGGLRRIFPDFSDADIVEAQVHREGASLPLPVFGTSLRSDGFRSPIPRLYLGGTAFVGKATINNDAALRTAAEAVREILAD